jgi:hypothetical protein
VRSGPLAGLTGHTIRHTYSNALVGLDVDPIIQLLLLAHKIPGIRGIYVDAMANFSKLLVVQEQVSHHMLCLVGAAPTERI